MANLHSEIKKLLPIDCKSKVDAVFNLLRRRNTVITYFVNDMICKYIRDNSLLVYYNSKISIAFNNIKNHSIVSTKKTNNSSKQIIEKTPNKRISPYILLGDNESVTNVKSKNKGISSLKLNWEVK